MVLPNIAIAVKNTDDLAQILKLYPNKLSFNRQISSFYLLDCHVQSSAEVLQIVAQLSAKASVKWCEPDMVADYHTCNPLYPQQYYLHNTGQNGGTRGFDINIEPAWQITQGNPNIKVAVIDAGVDFDHEDLANCMLPGYTAEGLPGNGRPINENIYDHKGHGTACAGIIAAEDNSLGVRGVASGVKIIPVNIFNRPCYPYISTGITEESQISDAIDWAYQHADVLNCSWGGGLYSNQVTQAIQDARRLGRNGKGCIVVFSSGNSKHPINWEPVSFPGNVEGVITVGAIDKFGNILHYSNRGPSMDVVALSDEIVTTDRMGTLGFTTNNYMTNFDGTSAACPQVAGVAALMLSANPDLTEDEVTNFIHETARDLGPNGFDETYGYGLVDAYAALKRCIAQIEGPSSFKTEANYYLKKIPEGADVSWKITKAGNPYTLTIDSLQKGHCTITKHPDINVILTLEATVTKDGTTLQVITKEIHGIGNLTGTYRQEACFYYVQHPEIKEKPLRTSSAMFVHQGCIVEVKMPYSRGLNITHEGYPPEVWSLPEQGRILFSFPRGSSGVPIQIVAKDDQGAECYRALFMPVSENGNIVENALHVKGSGNLYHITIEDTDDKTTEQMMKINISLSKKNEPWKLDIYNVTFGTKVYSGYFLDNSLDIDTSGWSSGTYVLHATKGNNTCAEKIQIR